MSFDKSRYGNWREDELSLKEVIKKYPKLSKFAIIKADVQRRGVVFTEKAMAKFEPNIHSIASSCLFSNDKGYKPTGLMFRDGTSVLFHDTGENRQHREPYIVDFDNNSLVLTDNDEIVETVEYWEKADYFDKLTSKNNAMWALVSNRPQRIDITGGWYCHFWDKPGGGCKYCSMGAQGGEKKKSGAQLLQDPKEVAEVVAEALKQKGRFTNIMITSGSILSGEELLDDELNFHIELLQEIGKLFKTERFPSQLIGTAYNKRQLERLYNETGLMSYTADIEVLNETVFNRLCPGKAEFIGYNEWKKRLKDAARIFGKGHVNTGLVTGTELAPEIGFKTEDAAFYAMSEEAEELAEAGVGVAITVWQPSPISILKNSKNPSLDYYARLTQEYERIRLKYGLGVDFDDYRRCGNHCNTDLARLR
jgi:hypothetical protein